MLKLLIFLLSVSPAAAQTTGYLLFPSQAACLTRSQQMCAAMGCDGVETVYWWDCRTAVNAGTVGGNAVSAGSYAMRIDSGQFGATASNQGSNGSQGLSAAEQAAVVSTATANASTVFPWIISEPAFVARFTTAQQSAMAASTDPNIQTTWSHLGASAVTNLQNANIIIMAEAAEKDGIIPSARVILAWTLPQ